MFKEESYFYRNQLFEIEYYNQSSIVVGYHHGINFKTLVDLVGSSQLIYCEVYRVIENYQRNETLLLKIKTIDKF